MVGLLLGESLSERQLWAYGLALSGVLLATLPARQAA
jgi:EamA domain-containing membrane protein RarD